MELRTVTLKVEFETDNAAFEDPGEAARILHKIADAIEAGSTLGAIHDINGNRIGSYSFEEA